MSRPDSKAKLHYFPTPTVIVEAIAHYLTCERLAYVRLLDPCAGTGAALALLTKRLKEQHAVEHMDRAYTYPRPHCTIKTYGIEPELLRVKAATQCLDHVLHDSFFSTTLSTGESGDGGWQCAFVNPPYDTDTEVSKGGKKMRLEVTFLHRVTRRLCSSGILIWVVPQPVLHQAARYLAAQYEQLACLRFPDDHWQPDPAKKETISLYAQFDQVVLFAKKRCETIPPPEELVQLIHLWGASGTALTSLPLEGRAEEIPTYSIPNARKSEVTYFHSMSFDADAAARALMEVETRKPKGGKQRGHKGAQGKQQESGGQKGHRDQTERYLTGVWANQEYLAARFPHPKTLESGIGTPMMPLKNAHIAVLSVAGIANRAILEGKDGRRVIVKGNARKVPHYEVQETEEEIIETTTDAFESALWCIDVQTGGLIRVETGKASVVPFPITFESMSLPDFLDNFGASLTEQVARANPPRYQNEAALPWVGVGLQRLKRQPLGKQREVIMATVQGFLKPPIASTSDPDTLQTVLARTAPVAEMATGKTYLSLASAFLADRYACGGTSEAGYTVSGVKMPHIFPIIVLCPPIMARKWKREAEQTLPNARAVIIKRIGSPSSSSRKRQQAEEDEEGGPVTLSKREMDLADFRHFDPTFTGTGLSAIGCLDRVVRRIRYELDEWKRAYTAAVEAGTTPPLKPCHVVIITGSAAKLGKEWMPIYRLKVARTINRETGKVIAHHDEYGKPYTIPCCPHCFRLLKEEKRVAHLLKSDEDYRAEHVALERLRAERRVSEWEEEAIEPLDVYLTEKELRGTGDRRVKRFCGHCGSALWQWVETRPDDWQPASVLHVSPHPIQPLPLPGRSATQIVRKDQADQQAQDATKKQPQSGIDLVTSTFHRRYPLGEYLQRRYKKRRDFGLLIADEVHEGGDGSALDFARQRLAGTCRRMMGLTGTLSNGYAGSLFRLYYTLSGAVRRDFGYPELDRWIDLYGKRQVTQKTYKKPREEREAGHGSSSDRRIGKPIIREMAGFAPLGLSHILGCSTFLELIDVAPALPPYREHIFIPDMGNPLEAAYEAFERDATRELGAMLAADDKSGLASWWNGLLNYPNMPYRGWICIRKSTGEIFATAPALPETIVYPKEQAIISTVRDEMAAGRRVLIYTVNTGVYDVMPRLQTLLERSVPGRNGQPLKVAILRSTTVETIDREAWLDQQVAEGVDVLICNPKLVKIGLDLLAFPTIIYASLPTSTSDLRQSARRSHRPGQTKPVKVIFFAYPGMEMRLLALMAKKTKVSLMVEGQLPKEGLVSFGEDDEADNEQDMYVQLAREVLASLEAGEEGKRSVQEQAEALQALYSENAQIEQEKQQLLGQEQTLAPVELEPLRVQVLTTSAIFPEPQAIREQPENDEPVPSAVMEEATKTTETTEVVEGTSPKKAKRARKAKKTAYTPKTTVPTETVSPPAQPVTVTIIQTAITTGVDPWAALRAQYLPARKRRKKLVAATEKVVSLWDSIDLTPPALQATPAKEVSASQDASSTLIQTSLW